MCIRYSTPAELEHQYFRHFFRPPFQGEHVLCRNHSSAIMNTACFVSPTLPLTPRGLPRTVRTASSTRIVPTASLRFPFGNPFNPFSGSSNSGKSIFKNFDSGHSGSNFGSGGRGRGRGRTPGDSGGGAEAPKNPLASLWAAYNKKLDNFPIITKAITSFIGFLIGDLLAQKFLGEKNAEIDLKRLARMASFGFLIHGPTGHFFYSALDSAIVGTSPLKVVSKVVIDQTLWAPIFTVMFFTYLGLTERKSMDDIVAKIKNDTWIGVTTSWKFWPLAHTINFAFIPTSQRLLYVNTLQVGYNVILSIIGNK